MDNNNLYIAEDFKPTFDPIDGSLIAYIGPNIRASRTTLGLDLSKHDEPSVYIDHDRDDSFTAEDLRELIPALERVLHDMDQYEKGKGGPHDAAL